MTAALLDETVLAELDHAPKCEGWLGGCSRPAEFACRLHCSACAFVEVSLLCAKCKRVLILFLALQAAPVCAELKVPALLILDSVTAL